MHQIKKITNLAMILAVALVLTACDHQASKGDKQQTETSTVSSSKPSQSESKSEKSDEQNKENPDHIKDQDTLSALKTIFVNDRLPTDVYGQNNQLIAAKYSTPRSQNYNIDYFETNQPMALNDAKLEGLSPFATFKKSEYGTYEEAKNAVGYTIPDGIPTMLNHGIQGFQQGAAGSTYIGWQEGKWSILFQTTNANGEDALKLANQIVDLLETIYLPAPTDVGQIRLHSGSTNELAFNNGNTVYSLTHRDSLSLLKMAASIK